jgi:predicted ATPase/class 3 adenylate cyclase
MSTTPYADRSLSTEAVTFLFTDIEGSTRLWEQEAERMRPALACHDVLTRTAVESHNGKVVKMTGDGVYAAFSDALDAVGAALKLQQALADSEATGGVPLKVRCGLHAGVVEHRDNDYFGIAVSRAARIMGAAHGGQIIVSQEVVDRVSNRIPKMLSFRDLGAVRLRDLARVEHVYQMLHPQLRQDFPPLRSLESTPNNLPQQVSSFVGRERELAEVRTLFQKSRLITLVGVGGLGKTRLSLHVGANLLDDYPDGVWLVELAPLTDRGLVPQAVASVLGVREEGGRPVEEALLEFARDRRFLLILDNCEHLAQASASLAKELLQCGPHVKILVSSREPLHIAGETTYPLSTLATPDPKKHTTVVALSQLAAAQLFIDRAVAAQPAFSVTDRNATTVAEVCHRLDGIPLALELAAARVRTLPLETIADRLSDRFHLLTGGDTTALPRQQTLRACIDWSFDLLTASERVVLRRLAVFAGGWTLPAAESVAGELKSIDVLDLLSRLVEKSLVEFDSNGGRYRLLETVRQYAEERLCQSGDRVQTYARHFAFYAALSEAATEKLLISPNENILLQLDAEKENLLAAHAWCDRFDGDAEGGLRLVRALRLYWHRRGPMELGYRMTVEALDRAGAQKRTLARCLALSAAGNLRYVMGRYAEAQRHLQESLSIAVEIGREDLAAAAHVLLGAACVGRNERRAARGHYEEALLKARKLGDKRRLADALNSLAELNRTEGHLDSAEPLYEETLALAVEQDDRENIGVNLLNLAMVSIGREARGRARTILLEAMTIAESIGSRNLGQSVLDVVAGLAGSHGGFEREAARLYGAAQAHGERSGFHRDPADEAFLAPLIAQAKQVLGEVMFNIAEATGRGLSYELAMAEARKWLEQE